MRLALGETWWVTSHNQSYSIMAIFTRTQQGLYAPS